MVYSNKHKIARIIRCLAPKSLLFGALVFVANASAIQEHDIERATKEDARDRPSLAATCVSLLTGYSFDSKAIGLSHRIMEVINEAHSLNPSHFYGSGWTAETPYGKSKTDADGRLAQASILTTKRLPVRFKHTSGLRIKISRRPPAMAKMHIELPKPTRLMRSLGVRAYSQPDIDVSLEVLSGQRSGASRLLFYDSSIAALDGYIKDSKDFLDLLSKVTHPYIQRNWSDGLLENLKKEFSLLEKHGPSRNLLPSWKVPQGHGYRVGLELPTPNQNSGGFSTKEFDPGYQFDGKVRDIGLVRVFVVPLGNTVNVYIFQVKTGRAFVNQNVLELESAVTHKSVFEIIQKALWEPDIIDKNPNFMEIPADVLPTSDWPSNWKQYDTETEHRAVGLRFS